MIPACTVYQNGTVAAGISKEDGNEAATFDKRDCSGEVRLTLKGLQRGR